ncbi:hypothetical protein CL615_02310 [archaeon]|jgi:hypothetical protein|nr:hypothetical protein [archaeon]MDP6547709.1 hypothetical protein [Candidatus Woesearchaeota archaeon]|tara:strand:- start:8024 stop:8809 length:786 start_codon:yes stop_codon:yes gene_type:complete
MKLKNKFKESIFFDTFNSIKTDKKILSYVILIDVLFFVGLWIFGLIFNSFILTPASVGQVYYLLALVIIYYLGLLFIYSFFKYIILSFIKSVFSKNKLDFGRLGKFFLLNLVNFLILFFSFFILSLLAASVKEGIAPFIAIVILLAFFVFSYACVNISQVLFYEGKSLGNSLQMAAKNLGKVNKYYGVFLIILSALAVIALFFGTFGAVLKNTLFQDYNSLLRYGDIYTIIFVHSVGIIFYIAILFNRFYFYNIVKKKFLK